MTVLKHRMMIPAVALVALLFAVGVVFSACGGSTTTTLAAPATSVSIATTTTVASTSTTAASTATSGATTGSSSALSPELVKYAGDMLGWAQAFQALGTQMEAFQVQDPTKITAADLAKLDTMATAMHTSADQLRAITAPASAAAAHAKVVTTVDALVKSLDDLIAGAKNNDPAAVAAANKEITTAGTDMQSAMTEWAALFAGGTTPAS